MADPIFSNLTYAGEHFAEVFGPSVLDAAGLIDNDLATPLDNTKFKMTINEMDDVVEFQDPSPNFNDQGGDGDIDEVNITTVPYEFHKELAWANIRKSWLNNQLRPGSLNDYQPDQITQDYIAKVFVPKLMLGQNHLVLNGKVGLDPSIGSYTFSAAYSGLYPLLNASSSVGKLAITADQLTVLSVTKGATTVLTVDGDHRAKVFAGNRISIRLAAGTGWSAINVDAKVLAVELVSGDTAFTVDLDTDALTSSNYTANSARIRYINRTNIIGLMSNHLAFVPDSVRRAGAKIALPTHLELEWQFANAQAQENGGGFFLTAYQMQMISQRIVVLDSAPANTIGTWEARRVGYAYDLADDASNVELTWLGDKTGDKVYRLRGAMKTGVQISKKFAKEITLTTPDA